MKRPVDLDPISATMLLVGWCTLGAGLIVAVSPGLSAVFFVVALGLAIAIALSASTEVAMALALVLGVFFAAVHVASALGPVATGAIWTNPMADPFLRPLATWLPAVLGAAVLVGGAGLAGWVKRGLGELRTASSSAGDPLPRGEQALQQLVQDMQRAQRSRHPSVLARIRCTAAGGKAAQVMPGADEPAARVGHVLRPHLRPADVVLLQGPADLLVLLPQTTERHGKAVLRRLERAAGREAGYNLSTQTLSLAAGSAWTGELVPELDGAAVAPAGSVRPVDAEGQQSKTRARPLRALE